MKKSTLIVFLFLLIGWTSSGLKAQYGWFEQNAGTSHWLNAVCFVDSLTGWAAGDNYTIRKTTDGGQSWMSQSFGQAGDWADIFFVNADTGWLAGKQGQIYRSTDGGSNWNIQHLSYAWKSIHFSDALHGWCVGYNGWIVATTDGGATWTNQTSGTNNYLNEVFFIDNNRGWAVGNATTLIRTTNGGNNWFSVTDSDLYCDLNAIHFTGSDTGFTGGDCSVFGSTNGGTSNGWTDLWPSGYQGDINAIQFIDSQRGWIAGTQGKIWATEDGGASWTEQTSPFGSTIEDICFASPTQGWAVGWGGTVLHTSTGGITGLNEMVTARMSVQCYPNPFSESSTLRIEMIQPGNVELTVHDIRGEQVSSPTIKWMDKGSNTWEWGHGLAAGLYFVHIGSEAGGEVSLKVVKH